MTEPRQTDWLDSVAHGGAMQGPFHRTRPVTITRLMRFRRWWRELYRNALRRIASRWL
jgi:hypothetical protein